MLTLLIEYKMDPIEIIFYLRTVGYIIKVAFDINAWKT
jgi:hypothetical protein